MSTESNAEKAALRLREYLLDGIAREILRAEEAYSLAQEIGKYAEQINTANFGEFFGSLQIILSDRQTLSVVKIFDQVKKYPTRSIPGTLSLLEDNADHWELPERQELHHVLVKAGSNILDVERLGNAELTRLLVAHFRSTLPKTQAIDSDQPSLPLTGLLQFRDKVVAHNEAIETDTLQEVTWGDAASLVNYAKDFVIAVGLGYLGMYFGASSDDYLLTSDAHRTSIGLRRLLKKAGITVSSRP